MAGWTAGGGGAAITSRDMGLLANRVVRGYSVLLEDIPQQTEECLETDTQAFSAT